MPNKIISIEYSFNPFTTQAFLTIQSDVLEPLFKKLGFETKTYNRGDYDNFDSLTGYLVRGIGVDADTTFTKKGKSYSLQTQRMGNAHILIKSDESGRPIVNISQLRLVGTKSGARFEVFPINSAKVKVVLNTYCEGASYYYKKLQEYAKNISKFDKKK